MNIYLLAAAHCNTLRDTATHCYTLLHTWRRCRFQTRSSTAIRKRGDFNNLRGAVRKNIFFSIIVEEMESRLFWRENRKLAHHSGDGVYDF